MCHLLQRSLYIYTFSFDYFSGQKTGKTSFALHIRCWFFFMLFGISIEMSAVLIVGFVFLRSTENRNEYIHCMALDRKKTLRTINEFTKSRYWYVFFLPFLAVLFVCLSAFINLRSCHQFIYCEPNAIFIWQEKNIHTENNRSMQIMNTEKLKSNQKSDLLKTIIFHHHVCA